MVMIFLRDWLLLDAPASSFHSAVLCNATDVFNLSLPGKFSFLRGTSTGKAHQTDRGDAALNFVS